MILVNPFISFPVSGGSPTSIPICTNDNNVSNDIGAITVPISTLAQVGDILLLFVETADQAITVSGWTEANNSPVSNSGNSRLTVFWKRMAAGDVSAITSDSGDHQVGIMLYVRGCLETGDPFDVTAGGSTGTGTTGSVNGAATTEDNCLVVLAIAGADGSNFWDGGTSWVNADLDHVFGRGQWSASSGNGGSVAVAAGEKPSAGAYGASTDHYGGSATPWEGWTGALLPAETVKPLIVIRGGVSSGTGAISPSYDTDYLKENDVMVMFVETNNQAITVPGWTEAGSSPASNAGTNPTRLTVFWHRYDGVSLPSTTTSDSGDHQIAQIITVRNCVETGDPFDVTNSGTGGTGTSISTVGATTTVDNCLALVAVGTTRDISFTTSFSGWTNSDLTDLRELTDQATASGTGGGFGVAYGYKDSAGAYGTTAVTQATSVEYVTWTGALKPR